jgi:hypothetical protein
MTEESIETVYVDAPTLRQRFNALGYYAAVVRGELVGLVRTDNLAGPNSGQPPGTRTQRVYYMQGQTLVAIVHQYLRPDGKLGGSGLPDPKWLRDGRRILKLAPAPAN